MSDRLIGNVEFGSTRIALDLEDYLAFIPHINTSGKCHIHILLTTLLPSPYCVTHPYVTWTIGLATVC